MLPAERYARVIKVTRLCAAICGADVADPNYRINYITMLVVFCITFYFLFSAYTIQLKISENWGILLECFCMVGSVLQGITKLASGICFTKYIVETDGYLLSLYKTFQAKNEKYVRALNECVSGVSKLLKGVAWLYVILIGSIFSVPIILYVYTSRRYFIMQFYLPGLDPNTDFGYFATMGVQLTCLLFGAFGNFAGDMFMLVFNSHIVIFVDIFKLKISELNEMAEGKLDVEQTKRQLIDIVEWHQTYSKYADDINSNSFWIIFVQITTAALSIVFTLFLLLTGDWPGSYAYLLYQVSIMYLYCGLGTLVEISNDTFCDEIYNVHWYKLPIPQQKIILLMLMKSQDPTVMTVGGVAPLSVTTALQVTKSVYSISMMFMNFIE